MLSSRCRGANETMNTILMHLLRNCQQLKKEATDRLAAICKGPEYPNFLRQLIVQGLIKIEEKTVEIQARTEDKLLVSQVVSCLEDKFSMVILTQV